MRRARVLLAAVAAFLGGARALRAQAIPLELEFGYRFVDVSGNEQMYRTQINDRQGFLLRSLDYTSAGPLGHFLDFLHVDRKSVV